MARTAAGVVRADWVFRLPAGVIQPLTGCSKTEPRVMAADAVQGLALSARAPVGHLQRRIRDLSRRPAGGPVLPAAFGLRRIWFDMPWPAFTALVAIFRLMVSKPDFT